MDESGTVAARSASERPLGPVGLLLLPKELARKGGPLAPLFGEGRFSTLGTISSSSSKAANLFETAGLSPPPEPEDPCDPDLVRLSAGTAGGGWKPLPP
jgi:hypothetical protein